MRITPAPKSLPNFLQLELLFFSFCNGQFFPTAEESIEYYNQKRCVDGKGLILPSQIVSEHHCYTQVYSYDFVFILIWTFWKITEICEVFWTHLNLFQWWKSATPQVFTPFQPWCRYDTHVYCALVANHLITLSRCMLRGFRLHRCPYWIRPSITVSNHNGVYF